MQWMRVMYDRYDLYSVIMCMYDMQDVGCFLHAMMAVGTVCLQY